MDKNEVNLKIYASKRSRKRIKLKYLYFLISKFTIKQESRYYGPGIQNRHTGQWKELTVQK